MTETAEDLELFHFGVKGMKWGVRKKRKTIYRQRVSEIRNRPLEHKTLTTKTGLEIEVSESRTPLPAARLIAASSKLYEKNKSFHSYDIKDKNGRGLGQADFELRDNGEINLVWLGVNPNSRGQGIATSIFDLGIAKGQELGAKKLTLEVPGNSPDAKHIYTKAGFKDDGPMDDYDPDDAWGGLTKMSMDIKSIKHSANADDDEVEEALVRLFEHKLQIVQGDISHANESPEDLELFHFGVKGMKWGVRKDKSSTSSSSKSTKPGRKRLKEEDIAEGYTKRKYENDRAVVGTKRANRINADIANGGSREAAYEKQVKGRQRNAGLASAGVALAITFSPAIDAALTDGINRSYLKLADAAEKKKMRDGVKKANDILADSRGLTNYETVSLNFEDGVWK